ncbi:3959_t:CDS:2, partial [Dentiscutata erythropus]
MNTLQSFLRVEPLNQITISRVLHKYWKDCGVNTEEADCEHVIKILKELTDGDIDESRKQHFTSLQDIEKIQFMWKELNALMKDTDLFRPKHDKPKWKTRATCNIGSMKEILRHLRNESQTHFHLFEMLCDANVDKLLCNDPLVNSIVDLGSPRFSLKEEEQNVLAGERSSIKGLSIGALVRQVCANFITKRNEIKQRYRFMILPSEKVTHARWVEQEYERER